MNPVIMTIINLRIEYWPSWRFEPATASFQVFYATVVEGGRLCLPNLKARAYKNIRCGENTDCREKKSTLFNDLRSSFPQGSFKHGNAY